MKNFRSCFLSCLSGVLSFLACSLKMQRFSVLVGCRKLGVDQFIGVSVFIPSSYFTASLQFPTFVLCHAATLLKTRHRISWEYRKFS